MTNPTRYLTWGGEARIPAKVTEPTSVEAARASSPAPVTWRVAYHYTGPGGAVGRAWVGIGRITDVIDFELFSAGQSVDSFPAPAQEIRIELVALPNSIPGEHVLKVFIAPEGVIV